MNLKKRREQATKHMPPSYFFGKLFLSPRLNKKTCCFIIDTTCILYIVNQYYWTSQNFFKREDYRDIYSLIRLFEYWTLLKERPDCYYRHDHKFWHLTHSTHYEKYIAIFKMHPIYPVSITAQTFYQAF